MPSTRRLASPWVPEPRVTLTLATEKPRPMPLQHADVCAAVRVAPSSASDLPVLLQTLLRTAAATPSRHEGGGGRALGASLAAYAFFADRAAPGLLRRDLINELSALNRSAPAGPWIRVFGHEEVARMAAPHWAYARNDYGYIATDAVVLWLRRRAACRYLLVTNADNVYLRGFLPETEAAMHRLGVAAVTTHFISHYHIKRAPGSAGAGDVVQRTGANQEVAPKWEVSKIDLGAVLIRMAFVHRANLTFAFGEIECAARGECPETPERAVGPSFFTADGVFAHALATRSNGSVHIVPQILFAHQ